VGETKHSSVVHIQITEIIKARKTTSSQIWQRTKIWKGIILLGLRRGADISLAFPIFLFTAQPKEFTWMG
jgi:hypothetical protein